MTSPTTYWEARARRFAGRGDGLAAVCSYGMPAFYNRYIEWTQRLALAPWLATVEPDARVLDLGCGIGRWSRRLARRGARVTGVDLSSSMLAEARRRTAEQGLLERCRFVQADLAELDLGERFDHLLCVTVLQHVMEPARLDRAVGNLARHVAAGGRVVLLEAAPGAARRRCDTAIFTARGAADYRALLGRHGLAIEAETGVDPSPWKTLLLPVYRRLPQPLALGLLAGATLLSLPLDLPLGRYLATFSWHKVFVCRAPGDAGARAS